MAGICGYNVAGGSTTAVPANGTALVITGLYTAVVGDVIDQFFFYGHDGWTAGGNLDVCLYVFAGGVPTTRVHVPVNIAPPDSVSAWQSSAGGLGIPLVAGVQYCMAVARNTVGRIHFDVNANGGSEGASLGLVDPHVETILRNNDYSMYANIIAGGSPPVVVGRSSVVDFNPFLGDF